MGDRTELDAAAGSNASRCQIVILTVANATVCVSRQARLDAKQLDEL